jgi:protein involved in polysaccharide export with SLBB domain
MVLLRRGIRYLVFQCLIIAFVPSSGRFSVNSFAQVVQDSQWSKSAKSLTIFQPGDAVSIQVWELYQGPRGDLSGEYPIDREGKIIMPIIGEVGVKGLTAYELTQTLEEKFRAYLKNPYVHVRPLIRMTMQGQFNRPGAYRIDPARSLWDLVRMAGGPTGNCDLRRMKVERGGKVAIKSLLTEFEKGYSLEEVGIESGDQIIAPPRGRMNIGVLIGVVNLAALLVLLYLRLRYGVF